MENETPKEAKEDWHREMRQMYQEALADPKNAQKTIRQIGIDNNIQKVRNMEVRAKIYKQRKNL